MITSKTSFLALIGNPVQHSLSPIIHNAVINSLDLDLVYLALPCDPGNFNIVINTLKYVNCKGLNITIPFKEKAFHLCKEVTPIAKKIKAINTLKLNLNGEWYGTNTDVDGFIYPLKPFDLKGKKSIVLGSGGAARSAIQGLLDLNLNQIIIISRNENSLNKIIEDFRNHNNIKGIHSNDNKIQHLISESDLIVNTTPVGMASVKKEELNLPFGENCWKSLNSKTIVYDLIYNPKETYLIKLASKKGCSTIDGSEMLIAQGAKSLEFWTDGLEIPINVMRNSLKGFL